VKTSAQLLHKITMSTITLDLQKFLPRESIRMLYALRRTVLSTESIKLVCGFATLPSLKDDIYKFVKYQPVVIPHLLKAGLLTKDKAQRLLGGPRFTLALTQELARELKLLGLTPESGLKYVNEEKVVEQIRTGVLDINLIAPTVISGLLRTRRATGSSFEKAVTNLRQDILNEKVTITESTLNKILNVTVSNLYQFGLGRSSGSYDPAELIKIIKSPTAPTTVMSDNNVAALFLRAAADVKKVSLKISPVSSTDLRKVAYQLIITPNLTSSLKTIEVLVGEGLVEPQKLLTAFASSPYVDQTSTPSFTKIYNDLLNLVKAAGVKPDGSKCINALTDVMLKRGMASNLEDAVRLGFYMSKHALERVSEINAHTATHLLAVSQIARTT